MARSELAMVFGSSRGMGGPVMVCFDTPEMIKLRGKPVKKVCFPRQYFGKKGSGMKGKFRFRTVEFKDKTGKTRKRKAGGYYLVDRRKKAGRAPTSMAARSAQRLMREAAKTCKGRPQPQYNNCVKRYIKEHRTVRRFGPGA